VVEVVHRVLLQATGTNRGRKSHVTISLGFYIFRDLKFILVVGWIHLSSVSMTFSCVLTLCNSNCLLCSVFGCFVVCLLVR